MSRHDEIMDHGYFQDRLSGYLDGELIPEETRALAEHLQSCADCRRRLEDLRRFEEMVSEQSKLGDSDYWEQSARRIEERLSQASREPVDIRPKTRRKSSGMWWKISAVAASIVLVGYIGLYRDEILRDIEGPSKTEQFPERKAPQLDTFGRPEAVIPPPETREKADYEQPPVSVPESKGASDEMAPPRTETVKIIGGDYVPTQKQVSPQGASKTESASAGKSTAIPSTQPDIIDRFPSSQTELTESPSEPVKSRRAAPVSTLADKDAGQPTVTPSQEESQPDLGKSIKVEGVVRQATETEATLTDSNAVQLEGVEGEHDLAYWRQVRDSLTSLGAERTPEIRGGSFRSLAAQPSALTQPKSESKAKSLVEAKQPDPLLEAWYQICRMSSDSAEVSRGRHFLDSVAADAKSLSQGLAKGYIERLGHP